MFPVRGDQVGGGNCFTFFFAQHVIRHRHKPDVDVEAGLMADGPNGSGPPRGCAISPTRIPFQPVALAACGANFSRNLTSLG